MSHISIHIHDKSYRTANNKAKQVIKALHLSLHKNEFVCLVGASGCGKTTLLNILAGLDTDYAGEITFSTQQLSPKIAYVFQNPRLLPWRTVLENIELAANPDKESLDFLLNSMGLMAEKDTYPAHLSLGMSRRVSIIRAFAMNPDLLLMDEPFVSLDAPTARQMRHLLVGLWQKRPHTILFVTHDLREAIAMADRIIFLDKEPMSIIREVPIPLTREARNTSAVIEQFKQQLFIDYPEITALL